MAYQLTDINMKTVADPKGFVEECDELYNKRVAHAADLIINNMAQSPIVLLSGPSGSGKTTTSMKIAEALEKKGVAPITSAWTIISRPWTQRPCRVRPRETWIWNPLCAWIWSF